MNQRRTLSDLRFLVGIQAATAALGFFTNIWLANTLGKEYFGDLSYALALGAYGLAFVQFGLDRTLVRELVHFPDRFNDLVLGSLIVRVGLLGVFLAFLLAYKFVAGPGLPWGSFIVIFASSLLALQLQGVFDARHEMRRHAWYFFLQRCVYFGLVWPLILALPERLSIARIGVFLSVSAGVGLLLQFRWVLTRVDFEKVRGFSEGARLLLRSNVWIWLSTLLGLSFASLNQIIVKQSQGSAELGGYAACWQIAQIANLLLAQIARVGRPATARHTLPGVSVSRRIRFLARYLLAMIAVASVLALPAILLPETMVSLFFRPEYLSAAGTLRILGGYLLIFAVGIVASQYTIALRLQKTYFATTAAAGLLSAGLCFYLIPRQGSEGAALALTLSHGAAIGVYVAAVIRSLHVLNRRQVRGSPPQRKIDLGRIGR